jgi:hypothetical protein
LGDFRRAGDLLGFDRKRKSRLRFLMMEARGSVPSTALPGSRLKPSDCRRANPGAAFGGARNCGIDHAMLHFGIDRHLSAVQHGAARWRQALGKAIKNPKSRNRIEH